MHKLLFLSVLFLFGCASLPMVTSVKEQPEGKYEYSYYNKENQILYKVTNDENNLHLILNTTAQASILKILKTGLTIYFDVNGKKKRDVFVHYPFKLKSDLEKEEFKKEDKGEPSGRSLNYFVSQIPPELIFSSYSVAENINLNNKDADIKDSITVLNKDEIVYELTIPLSRISKKGSFSLANLSIGVVSGKFEIPNNHGPISTRPVNAGNGSGAGGMVSNGPAGGGMVNQASNDIPSGAGSTGDPELTALGIPIEFWFKVSLIK